MAIAGAGKDKEFDKLKRQIADKENVKNQEYIADPRLKNAFSDIDKKAEAYFDRFLNKHANKEFLTKMAMDDGNLYNDTIFRREVLQPLNVYIETLQIDETALALTPFKLELFELEMSIRKQILNRDNLTDDADDIIGSGIEASQRSAQWEAAQDIPNTTDENCDTCEDDVDDDGGDGRDSNRRRNNKDQPDGNFETRQVEPLDYQWIDYNTPNAYYHNTFRNEYRLMNIDYDDGSQGGRHGRLSRRYEKMTAYHTFEERCQLAGMDLERKHFRGINYDFNDGLAGIIYDIVALANGEEVYHDGTTGIDGSNIENFLLRSPADNNITGLCGFTKRNVKRFFPRYKKKGLGWDDYRDIAKILNRTKPSDLKTFAEIMRDGADVKEWYNNQMLTQGQLDGKKRGRRVEGAALDQGIFVQGMFDGVPSNTSRGIMRYLTDINSDGELGMQTEEEREEEQGDMQNLSRQAKRRRRRHDRKSLRNYGRGDISRLAGEQLNHIITQGCDHETMRIEQQKRNARGELVPGGNDLQYDILLPKDGPNTTIRLLKIVELIDNAKGEDTFDRVFSEQLEEIKGKFEARLKSPGNHAGALDEFMAFMMAFPEAKVYFLDGIMDMCGPNGEIGPDVYNYLNGFTEEDFEALAYARDRQIDYFYVEDQVRGFLSEATRAHDWVQAHPEFATYIAEEGMDHVAANLSLGLMQILDHVEITSWATGNLSPSDLFDPAVKARYETEKGELKREILGGLKKQFVSTLRFDPISQSVGFMLGGGVEGSSPSGKWKYRVDGQVGAKFDVNSGWYVQVGVSAEALRQINYRRVVNGDLEDPRTAHYLGLEGGALASLSLTNPNGAPERNPETQPDVFQYPDDVQELLDQGYYIEDGVLRLPNGAPYRGPVTLPDRPDPGTEEPEPEVENPGTSGLSAEVYGGALWERDRDIALKQLRQRYTEVSLLTYSYDLFMNNLTNKDTPESIRQKLYDKVDDLGNDRGYRKFIEQNKPRLLSDIDVVVGLMELMLYPGGSWMIDTSDLSKFSEGLLKFSRLVQTSNIEGWYQAYAGDLHGRFQLTQFGAGVAVGIHGETPATQRNREQLGNWANERRQLSANGLWRQPGVEASKFWGRLKRIPIPVYLKAKFTAWENYYIPSAKKMHYIQEQLRLGFDRAPEEAQGSPEFQAAYLQRTFGIPGLRVDALPDGRIQMSFERQALNQENNQGQDKALHEVLSIYPAQGFDNYSYKTNVVPSSSSYGSVPNDVLIFSCDELAAVTVAQHGQYAAILCLGGTSTHIDETTLLPRVSGETMNGPDDVEVMGGEILPTTVEKFITGSDFLSHIDATYTINGAPASQTDINQFKQAQASKMKAAFQTYKNGGGTLDKPGTLQFTYLSSTQSYTVTFLSDSTSHRLDIKVVPPTLVIESTTANNFGRNVVESALGNAGLDAATLSNIKLDITDSGGLKILGTALTGAGTLTVRIDASGSRSYIFASATDNMFRVEIADLRPGFGASEEFELEEIFDYSPDILNIEHDMSILDLRQLYAYTVRSSSTAGKVDYAKFLEITASQSTADTLTDGEYRTAMGILEGFFEAYVRYETGGSGALNQAQLKSAQDLVSVCRSISSTSGTLSNEDKDRADYIINRFKTLSSVSKDVSMKVNNPAAVTQALSIVPSSNSYQSQLAALEAKVNDSSYADEFRSFDWEGFINEYGDGAEEIFYAFEPASEVVYSSTRILEKLANRQRYGAYKRMLEADPVIGANPNVVAKFEQYQTGLASRVSNVVAWNREVHPTLIGMGAFYRGSTRTYSVLQPGSISVVPGSLGRVDYDAGVAAAFVEKLDFNNRMLENIVDSINMQIESKLGANAPDYSVDHVLAILRSGNSETSAIFSTDNGDAQITLSFDYLTFLMGECCNEGYGVKPKIEIEREKGGEQGFGGDEVQKEISFNYTVQPEGMRITGQHYTVPAYMGVDRNDVSIRVGAKGNGSGPPDRGPITGPDRRAPITNPN